MGFIVANLIADKISLSSDKGLIKMTYNADRITYTIANGHQQEVLAEPMHFIALCFGPHVVDLVRTDCLVNE